MIFYTDKFIPKRFAAFTLGLVIFIRPAYSLDKGLCEHEKVHVHQFKTDLLYSLRYTLSKKWRLKYEAEAYAEQMRWAFDKDKARVLFAGYLVDKYKLGITTEQALAALDIALAKRQLKQPQ